MERAFGRLFRFGTVLGLVCAALRLVGVPAHARDTNFVIIDQDTTGPGGSGMNAVLALLQSRDVDVLGITVPSGDNWREAEVAHALRLLEIIGRTDIRVFPECGVSSDQNQGKHGSVGEGFRPSHLQSNCGRK
jgi:hypothetical protein